MVQPVRLRGPHRGAYKPSGSEVAAVISGHHSFACRLPYTFVLLTLRLPVSLVSVLQRSRSSGLSSLLALSDSM